ncbi:MAG: arsenate reductase ArsC [Planctomycetota bacterium]
MPAPYNVLFICTGNCCRSQMAEALLRHYGGQRFNPCSAGAAPAGFVHPLALETLRRMNISTQGQYSKSWDEFADRQLDIILTVCDNVADRPCPTWPGHPATAHWGVYDPSFHPGNEKEKFDKAMEMANILKGRIQQLINLPLDQMNPQQLKTELAKIGQS